MSKAPYPNRTSAVYWILGGDLFWYHFKLDFLKRLLIFQIGFSVLLNVIRTLDSSLIFNISVVMYLLITTVGTVLIMTNNLLANYVMREHSQSSDANWVFYFILSLCVFLLIALSTGIGVIN